jgi:hypothetical protein
LRSLLRNILPQERDIPRLDRGWIIANHKLVSFHAAFLTSLLSISTSVASRFDVVRQMFLSAEVLISAVMWYVAWHTNIAIHEIGHYLAAVRTNNLRPELAGPAQQKLNQGGAARWAWYLEMFAKIPYGSFAGVNKEAGSFHPSVKTQNLAVSAAGPKASLTLCQSTLPLGFVLVALGLLRGGVLAGVHFHEGLLDPLGGPSRPLLLDAWRGIAAATDPVDALAQGMRLRLLTALRDGQQGASVLNARIEDALAGRPEAFVR